MVCFSSEMLGLTGFAPSMIGFFEFIVVLGLVDLSVVGGIVTGSNNRKQPFFSQLDRFLVSVDWAGRYVHLRQLWLSWWRSDHFSVLLEFGPLPPCHRPFRFKNMRLLGFSRRFCGPSAILVGVLLCGGNSESCTFLKVEIVQRGPETVE